MMRSMFTGVAGLRTHQTKMDVISNNIANVNTVGFKSNAVKFNEVFAQTIRGASQADEETGRGGTNPVQIGLGVSVASIDTLMTQGAAQTTDNPLDLMINGDAFFVVGDASGQYFTRAGSFRLDAQGTLVNSSGLKVYGWSAVEDPDNPGQTKISKGTVQSLEIKTPQNMSISPKMTENIGFEGNLNIEEGQTDGITKTMDFYDSLGNYYKVDITYKYHPASGTTPSYWSVTPATTMTRNETETLPFEWNHRDCTLQFNEFGKVVAVDGDTENLFLDFTITSDLGEDAVFADSIKLDLSNITQFASTTSLKGEQVDGCAPGELTGFSIGQDGTIIGNYSNGRSKMLGQIAVANFRNPMGLERVGDNLFIPTANSGEFNGTGEEPTANGGSITGGTLEMSNVDLSREFTDMITTQRGFQANSKTITTSDEMLQTIVNMK